MKVRRILPLTFLALPLLSSACGDKDETSGDGDGDGDQHGDGDDDHDHGDGDVGDGDGDVGDGDVGDGDAGDGDASDGDEIPVTLTFRAQVGDELFECGETYEAQGSTEVEVTPQDFRFYVSDVRLIDDEGNEVPVTLDARSPWQSPDVALLDFEDGTAGCSNGNAPTNVTVTGTVPDGDYIGVAFSPAVPLELNHEDPATLPAPLQAGGMTWGWLFGYKFIRAEVAATASPDAGKDPGSGVFHLGSTGCDNASEQGGGGAGGAGGAGPDYGSPPTVECARQNRAEIRFDDGFSPSEDVIVADIGALMREADLSIASGCHSGGEYCDDYFESVGLDFETGAQLEEQTAFRIEAE
jgi:uncharacterized repeat protein (TIGR04052 family)